MPVPTTTVHGSPSHSPSSSSMGAPSTNISDMRNRMARMEAFRQLKPTCVSLMAIASQPPTLYSQHAKLIDSLLSQLESIPVSSLDPAVINYVLFPITTIMRQSNPFTLPEPFLESAFRLLSHTTSAWRRCEGGIDLVAWEQLWRFCIAAVGPRVSGKDGKDKGKGKEVGQEVQLQAVHLLAALLQSPNTNETGLPHPTPSMLDRLATSKSPLLPTLFQTITFLLETAAPDPPYLQLQMSSLRLLRTLIKVYLSGKHEVLAAVLPGTVSAMTKLVQADGKALKGDIAKDCVGMVEDVVVATLNDENLRRLGLLRPKVDNLSQLAEEWEHSATSSLDSPRPPSPAASTIDTGPSNPFPPLTASYLDFTSTQLLSAILPMISILSVHPSNLARHAVISLSLALLRQCSESLPLLRPRCLSILLSLSQDVFDPVQLDAKKRLRDLMGDGNLNLDGSLLDLLNNAMNSLPRLVTSQQDVKVDETARLITAISKMASEMSEIGNDRLRNPIAQLLGPDGGIERWSWSLLDCLEFGRPVGWSTAGSTAARSARLGWEKSAAPSGTSLLLEPSAESSNSGHAIDNFPHLPLHHVESENTSNSLVAMLASLGSAGGEATLHSVDYLVRFAKANRRTQPGKAVSALWVAEKLLDGVALSQMEGPEGRASKMTRKMARQVAKAVIGMDEHEDDGDLDDEDGVGYTEDPNAEALIPVERTKGIDTLTTLLDRKPLSNSHTAAETRRLHSQAQRALFTALSLESLTLSARILSSSFRPLLLTSLYLLLSHLASPHTIVREYATIALSQVAYHIGYATTQNMVIDNVDYVINVVSQRLTYRRLSSTAPLVLIAMIRLVGQEIVPLIHDVVDEIFDALDDYHGYEALASSLLAVLVTLIEVMAAEVEVQGVSEERSKKLLELRRVDRPPSPESDLEMLFKWFEDRQSRNEEQIGELLDRAPQHAWGKKDIPEEGNDEGEGQNDEPSTADGEEGEPAATRSQTVATSILQKSIYFLTHQSPFLRSKVLSLMSHAVPVLAAGNRESDFLPLIDKSWNSILNRLDDREPYVVTEAAEVIARLCEHAGDFMSKRVLDHAWPRMKILLNAQKELDKKSALSRRGAVTGTESKFTVSHRLHIAVIDVATFIAAEVPVSDGVIWEIVLLFRAFLDRRVDKQLQGKARLLYEKLGERDGDAVWMALSATMGELRGDERCWEHLKNDGLDISENATAVIAKV
ncbi:hypothetical protein IAT40_007262 [Kwoniella sp. CBS 6097]